MSSNADGTAREAPDAVAESETLVTLDEVEQSIDVFEKVFDNLSTDDEFLSAILANQVQMARTARKTNELIQETRLVRGADVTGRYVIDMSHNVPVDTPTTNPVQTVRVPDEQDPSRLTAVSLGWQDGTNHKVGIQLRTGSGEKLIPRNSEDQFLAFNDYTETFRVEKELAEGEEIVAETVNLNSGGGSKFVNIVPHISELDESALDDGGEN